MKKILLSCALALCAGVAANAQTVMSSRLFDNTYVSATVSGQMKMNDLNKDIFSNPVYPAFNIYVGKWITPKFGVELNAEAIFHNSFKSNSKFVDGTYLGANAMINLNNIFHGYKGKADLCEVVPFAGIGWMHACGNSEEKLAGVINGNGMGIKAGINVGFNVGKFQAWQINLRPSVMWAVNDYEPTHINSVFGRVALEAGFTYKFKNHYGTHNFVLAQLRDQAEIDALNDRIKALNDELAKKPKVVEKIVTKEVAAVAADETSFLISFDKGSDKVKTDVKNIVENLKKTNGTITITGNTSPEGPERVNKALAIRRAEAAKKALVEAGLDASRIKILNDYEDKRNAIIKLQK